MSGSGGVFRWLLAGRAVDQVGNAVQPIALGFAMLDVFGTTTALGVVVGAAALGQVLLLLAGGVVADRAPRSLVLVWSNVLAAAAQAVIVGLIVTDVAVLPAYGILAFITGAAAAFDGPATTALIPELVPADRLTAANGKLSVARQGAAILGAPLAGVLVAVIGPGPTLAVDALSFLVAAVCFSRLTGAPLPAVRATTPLRDLADGWREFTAHDWLWKTVGVAFFINAVLAGGLHVVGLAIGERTVGAEGWGLAMGAFGVGSLLGATLAVRARPRRPLLLAMLLVNTIALPLVALAAEASLTVLAAATFTSGVGVAVSGVVWDSAMQHHVARERLARVASIDRLGSTAAVPLGAFVAGPLAVAIGETTLVGWSAGLVVVLALSTLASRSIRQLPAPAAVNA